MEARSKDKIYERLEKLTIEKQQTENRITELDDQIKELKKGQQSE